MYLWGCRFAPWWQQFWDIQYLSKKFNICKSLLKKFDIYVKIVFRDAGIFFRHQAELVLRHQMRVSNYCTSSNFFTVYVYAPQAVYILRPEGITVCKAHSTANRKKNCCCCNNRGSLAHPIYTTRGQKTSCAWSRWVGFGLVGFGWVGLDLGAEIWEGSCAWKDFGRCVCVWRRGGGRRQNRWY